MARRSGRRGGGRSRKAEGLCSRTNAAIRARMTTAFERLSDHTIKTENAGQRTRATATAPERIGRAIGEITEGSRRSSSTPPREAHGRVGEVEETPTVK